MIRGVLGGSFDPVHNGHVAMAQFVLEHNLAEVVHVVPARISPHKFSSGASSEQRLDMIKLAFSSAPGVVVDERELGRPGPSFTVDTLEDMAAQYPADRLVLIIGQDNLAGLQSWKDPARIGALAEALVLSRTGGKIPDARKPAWIPAGLKVQYQPDFDQPVSSTTIRAILARPAAPADMLKDYLPASVADHITRHGLYRD